MAGTTTFELLRSMQHSLDLLNDKRRVPLWLKRRDRQELYLCDRDFKIRRLARRRGGGGGGGGGGILNPPNPPPPPPKRMIMIMIMIATNIMMTIDDDDDDDDLTPFIKRKNTEI